MGAGAAGHAHQPQRAGHQPGFCHRAHADHAVKTLAHQVHAAVGAAQLHLQQRVAGQQIRQRRQHQLAGNAGGHVNAHAPAQRRAIGLLKHGLQFVHIVQQVLAALVKGLPVLRQLHAPRGAVQQARAQVGLQLLHGQRGAGLGQAQHLRSLGKAAQLGHTGKDLHAV